MVATRLVSVILVVLLLTHYTVVLGLKYCKGDFEGNFGSAKQNKIIKPMFYLGLSHTGLKM